MVSTILSCLCLELKLNFGQKQIQLYSFRKNEFKRYFNNYFPFGLPIQQQTILITDINPNNFFTSDAGLAEQTLSYRSYTTDDTTKPTLDKNTYVSNCVFNDCHSLNS